MTLYPNLILDALRNVRYPGNGKDIVELGMVEDDMRIDGNKVSFSLIFDKPTDPFIRSVVKAAETAVLTYVAPDVEIRGNIAVKTRRAQPRQAGQSATRSQKYSRNQLRQGRCGQVDRSIEPGRGSGSPRIQGGSVGRRHIRAVGAQNVRHRGRTAVHAHHRRRP